jgi:hypothetical protein
MSAAKDRGQFALDRMDSHAWLLSTEYSDERDRCATFQAHVGTARFTGT